MIKAQEVETRIISIHNGCKIESAKIHGRQLTILILLSFLFLSFIQIIIRIFFYLLQAFLRRGIR